MPINYNIEHKIGTRAAHCLIPIVFRCFFPFDRLHSTIVQAIHRFVFHFVVMWMCSWYDCHGHVIKILDGYVITLKRSVSRKLWKRVKLYLCFKWDKKTTTWSICGFSWMVAQKWIPYSSPGSPGSPGMEI